LLYRAPFETDNNSDDISYQKSQGRSGCLGVAKADFDGDGKDDYLLAITAKNNFDKGRIVAALTKNAGWRIHQLSDDTPSVRSDTYVEVIKPQVHGRRESDDTPLSNGEKKVMHCSHWGAMTGKVESTGIVYCFIKGKWPHVWVSD
jgi:hypothetical protein